MRELLAVLLLLAAGVSPQQFLNCVISGGRSCCDKHRFCAFWARNNECNKNPTWMLPNCQLSCRVCTTDSVATQTLRVYKTSSVGLVGKVAQENGNLLGTTFYDLTLRLRADIEANGGCSETKCSALPNS
ncbi:shTK domain protein [Ancylostoma duodenale]|uniref:ShTK domain protein n=1 Tax=Ancylostoma duodenale TaxID=51022 RepID=A0A0C2FER4_9BILA|nr:shTK domain protein [Ancylostoma duodenale]